MTSGSYERLRLLRETFEDLIGDLVSEEVIHPGDIDWQNFRAAESSAHILIERERVNRDTGAE